MLSRRIGDGIHKRVGCLVASAALLTVGCGGSSGFHYPKYSAEGAIVKCCGSRPDRNQAATFSSVVVVWSSVTRTPSLNFAPASTSATSLCPLKRRQRSCAASSSL